MPYGVAVQPPDTSISAGKSDLRRRLIAARRVRSVADRQAARAANTSHLLARLSEATCVAAYLPLPTEPLEPDLLDRLAARTKVLVPVVTGAAPLDWCAYPAPTRKGALGIEEPNGQRLGSGAIAGADAVLVPALAVDPRGHRLGRGGGHYDRTLALQARLFGTAGPVTPGTGRGLRIAVLYDDELLDFVPSDKLDQSVQATVTPRAGFRLTR